MAKFVRPDILRSALARSSGSSFVVIGIGSATSFALQLILARTLGAQEYGSYLIVLGWMNVAALFTKIDLDAVAVRFVAGYDATKELGLLHGFLRWSERVTWGLGLLVAALGATLLTLHDFGLAPALRDALLAGCLLLPLTGAMIVQSGALQGLQIVSLALATSQLLRPAGMLVVVLITALALHGKLTAAEAILLNLAASAVAFAIGAWRLRRAAAPALAVPATVRHREWLTVCLQLLPITIAQLVISQQSDILVVGALLSPTDAAHYGAASQLASLVAIPSSAVLAVVLPRISELHVRGALGELQELLDASGKLTALAAVIPAILLALIARPVLSLYGPTFPEIMVPMLLLIVAQGISATVGAQAGNVMVMTGRQRDASIVIGGAAILNLVMGLVLTPHFGALGTAAATLLAVLVRSAVLTWYLRTRLKLNLLSMFVR